MVGWRDPEGYLHLNPNAPYWPKHWSSNPANHPPFTLKATARINKLPQMARELGIAVDELLYDGAFFMQEAWKEKVRVDTGQYRDSIEVVPMGGAAGVGLASFRVESDIPWSVWNEFGSVTITADHAAERSALEAEAWVADNIQRAITQATERTG